MRPDPRLRFGLITVQLTECITRQGVQASRDSQKGPQKGVRHPVILGAVEGAAASGSLFKVSFAFPTSIIGGWPQDLYVLFAIA
jgi:hypothetical protein